MLQWLQSMWFCQPSFTSCLERIGDLPKATRLGKDGAGIQTSACGRAQSCLTLFDPLDCSLPDSSVQGIFQARGLHLWSSMKFYKPLTYSEVYSGAGKCRYVGTFKRHTKNEVTHNVNHVNPDKRYLVGCTCETGTGGLAWQG